MQELIQEICQKTGISEEQAMMAIQVVFGQLKQHIPEPVASMIESQLNAGGAVPPAEGQLEEGGGNPLGGMLGGLGKMFGGN